MRDRLIELIASKVCEDYSPSCDEYVPHSCEKCYANSCRIGEIADHLLENGVIVPPCKVGDTVYRVSFVHKKVDVLKVDGFLANVASWKVHCTHIVPSWIDNKKEHVYIAFSSFEKNVFLTLKEAEQALKGERHAEIH